MKILPSDKRQEVSFQAIEFRFKDVSKVEQKQLIADTLDRLNEEHNPALNNSIEKISEGWDGYADIHTITLAHPCHTSQFAVDSQVLKRSFFTMRQRSDLRIYEIEHMTTKLEAEKCKAFDEQPGSNANPGARYPVFFCLLSGGVSCLAAMSSGVSLLVGNYGLGLIAGIAGYLAFQKVRDYSEIVKETY